MKVNGIAFTGYPVTDLKRARQFYEGTLGLKVSRIFGDEKTAWIEYDLGPATLAIGNMAPEWKPSPGGGSVGLEVEDFDAAIATCRANGGKFYCEPFESPVCRLVVVADPDGNSITLHKVKAAPPKS
jgi:predicted enzyme related to lactoylglutathione lyase